MEISNQLSALAHIAGAALLGAVIGWEREVAHRSAGLRTHMLIASAAAALILLGDVVIRSIGGQNSDLVRGDPVRIIQSIIVGTAFVGGGIIMREQGSKDVQNVTTAASIFVAATIGIAVALDQLIMAVGITGIVVVVNLLLLPLKEKI